MELSEFARSILLGDSLADKLVDPPKLVDEHPRGFEVPSSPARPQHLRWDRVASAKGGGVLSNKSASRPRFPGPSALAKPRGRGEAFHFFANHELLALELMAVALARFPGAPPDFRRQIAQAMREEQAHLRAYLESMAGYGVEFGEIPVSAFFWNTLAGMRTPLEYVAGMCLTFEQANLDFALYYRDRFADLGDACGAAVLQKVLDDEIGHVRIGVRWLRQFKDPRLDDFEAHAAALRAPLNLARAKGSQYFDAGVRRRAGLSAAYIERLRHAQASKGRAPTLWVFNPGFEAELWGQVAPKVAVLTRDLEYCMTYLGAADDVVALSQLPRLEFVASLEQAGYRAAEFVLVPPWPRPWSRQSFWHPRLAGCSPWGPSPAAFAAMGAICDELGGQLGQAPAPGEGEGEGSPRGKEGAPDPAKGASSSQAEPISQPSVVRARRELSNKNRALEWERAFIEGLEPPLRAKLGTQGTLIHSWSELWDWLHKTKPEARDKAGDEMGDEAGHEMGHEMGPEVAQPRWVLKDPGGTAGFGACLIDVETFDESQRPAIEARLARFSALRLEHWQSRRLDLSARYIEQKGKLELSGISRFLTDAGGHFLGVVLAPLAKDLDPPAIAFVYAHGQDPHWIPRIYRRLGQFLAQKPEFRGYRGGLGVDAYLYRAPGSSQLRLRPMVEINARWTMGHVADALGRRVHRSSLALWLHLSRRDLKRGGVASFEDLARLLPNDLDHIGAAPQGAIRRGRLWTTDPQRAQQRVSLLLAEKDLQSALALLGPLADRMAQKIQRGSGDALVAS